MSEDIASSQEHSRLPHRRLGRVIGRMGLAKPVVTTMPVPESEAMRKEYLLDVLSSGVLPPDQHARLADKSIPDYVLGIRQASADTHEKAVALLQGHNGLPVNKNHLGHSFLTFDAAYAKSYGKQSAIPWLTEGYFGDSSNFRYVVALPVSDENRQTYEEATASHIDAIFKNGGAPVDFFTPDPLIIDASSVNTKYIAGYIDDNNDYRPNPQFMIDAPTT